MTRWAARRWVLPVGCLVAATVVAVGAVALPEQWIRLASGLLLIVAGTVSGLLWRNRAIDVTALRRAETELRQHVIELHAIAAARRSVLAEGDVRSTVCRAALEATGALMVNLMEVEGDELVVTAQSGVDLPGLRLPMSGQAVAVQVFRSARARIVTDIHEELVTAASVVAALEQASGQTMGAVAYVPLLAQARCRGVLAAALVSSAPPPGTPVLDVLELLAGEAVIALDREDLQQRLIEQTRTDPLTSLPNRRALPDHLNHLPRDGGVAIIDLDHFKAYNDTHGHPAGDRLLVLFAEVLQETLRSEDIPARLGGEEFAVLTPCGDDLVGLLERLRQRWAAQRTGVTFSAGTAVHTASRSVTETLSIADDACYTAKHEGRNRTHAGTQAGRPDRRATALRALPVVDPASVARV